MESSGTAESIEVSLKLEEAKRRKREGLVILVTTLMVLAFAFFEVQLPETAPEYSLGNNIAFFLLINVERHPPGVAGFSGCTQLGQTCLRAQKKDSWFPPAGAVGIGVCCAIP